MARRGSAWLTSIWISHDWRAAPQDRAAIAPSGENTCDPSRLADGRARAAAIADAAKCGGSSRIAAAAAAARRRRAAHEARSSFLPTPHHGSVSFSAWSRDDCFFGKRRAGLSLRTVAAGMCGNQSHVWSGDRTRVYTITAQRGAPEGRGNPTTQLLGPSRTHSNASLAAQEGLEIEPERELPGRATGGHLLLRRRLLRRPHRLVPARATRATRYAPCTVRHAP